MSILPRNAAKTLAVLLVLCFTAAVGGLFIYGTSVSSSVSSVALYYKSNLDTLHSIIDKFEQQAPQASETEIRQQFTAARQQYKKIEFIVEYFYPASAQKLNGPPLPESETSEPNEPQHPTGFQVLETVVYGSIDAETRKQVTYELSNIRNRLNRLYALLPDLELSNSNILDAIRLNLYRLITKGITGFDAPVALSSISEAAVTLNTTREMLLFFPKSSLAVAAVDSSLRFIHASSGSFDDFDRAVFISEYINPLCKQLFQYQATQQIPFINARRALLPHAQTLFDANAFDPMFYAPSGAQPANPDKILLGRKLFGEPLLSATGKRSCVTCHNPSLAFTDGLVVNEALAPQKKLLRNTPTLFNAALQPVQFYDGHIAFLEDQAHDVISNQQEMGGLFKKIVAKVERQKEYKKLFAGAFKGGVVSAENIKSALAAYVRSLVALNSPFDKYMRGNKQAMNQDELKGFNLFMGKAKCGTCHFMPLFSGNVPPLFDKMESEVLGVPANTDTINAIQDLDSGKYHLYHIPHQLYSFKTSGLRNIAVTAPYMHNGVYETLDQVMDFYNRGGGAGLGFNLSNQTLPAEPLNLSDGEKKALIGFLNTLTDTTKLIINRKT